MSKIQKCKPIRDRVLLKAYEWPDKTKGGIFLPNILKYDSRHGGKDPWRGKILDVGSEVKQVRIGEIVRYQPNNYHAQTFEEDGVRYLFLEETLVYAVEDEEEHLIRALKNRVVFLPDELEEKYGSIYLPQRREEPLLKGIIVVAGEGSGVVEGDKVIMINSNTWQYFDSAGKRYIITDRYNLLALYESS